MDKVTIPVEVCKRKEGEKVNPVEEDQHDWKGIPMEKGDEHEKFEILLEEEDRRRSVGRTINARWRW